MTRYSFDYIIDDTLKDVQVNVGKDGHYIYYENSDLLLNVYELRNFNSELISENVNITFNNYQITPKGRNVIEAMDVSAVTGNILRQYATNSNSSINFTMKNKTGLPEYDAFYSGTMPNGSINGDLTKYCYNGLLASLDIFESGTNTENRIGIRCFKTTDLSFYHPIQITVDTSGETGTDLNDGIISFGVQNTVSGYTYQYTIDDGTTLETGNTFNNLSPGAYIVKVYNTDEDVYSLKKTITISEFIS